MRKFTLQTKRIILVWEDKFSHLLKHTYFEPYTVGRCTFSLELQDVVSCSKSRFVFALLGGSIASVCVWVLCGAEFLLIINNLEICKTADSGFRSPHFQD